MRIEAGKTYVDENGKKAGPLVGCSLKYISGRGGADDPEWSNDGTVHIEGEEGYGNLISEWTEHSPIRTETVTTRRLEPGVYGRLEVMFGVHGLAIGLTHQSTNKASYGTRLTAPELRELARVALEIAEYLENA
jgi:hypothetical protein